MFCFVFDGTPTDYHRCPSAPSRRGPSEVERPSRLHGAPSFSPVEGWRGFHGLRREESRARLSAAGRGGAEAIDSRGGSGAGWTKRSRLLLGPDVWANERRIPPSLVCSSPKPFLRRGLENLTDFGYLRTGSRHEPRRATEKKTLEHSGYTKNKRKTPVTIVVDSV